jgi:hypothetical protein
MFGEFSYDRDSCPGPGLNSCDDCIEGSSGSGVCPHMFLGEDDF